MGRPRKPSPKAKGATAEVDLSGVLPEVLEGARLVVLQGRAVLPASEQAGCSRHALGRLLKKPGVVEAIKALGDGAPGMRGSRARPRGGIPGPLEAQRDLQADQAQARREAVWSDHLARVPRDQTCATLGIAVRTYYDLLKEAREEAAKAFRAEAGSMVADLAEFYREVMHLAHDASLSAIHPPPLPNGLVDAETAAELLRPDTKGYAMCAGVALKAAVELATLAGIREPKGELPTAETAKRLADATSALSARMAARAAARTAAAQPSPAPATP